MSLHDTLAVTGRSGTLIIRKRDTDYCHFGWGEGRRESVKDKSPPFFFPILVHFSFCWQRVNEASVVRSRSTNPAVAVVVVAVIVVVVVVVVGKRKGWVLPCMLGLSGKERRWKEGYHQQHGRNRTS